MKVSREKMAENRLRILEIASALFRERGFDHVSVADVMKQAGLTHGGFYGHFASKEALAAEAAAWSLGKTVERWAGVLERDGMAGLRRIVDGYVSTRHRDDPGGGCAIVALSAELSRQDHAVRESFSREVRRMIEVLSPFMRGGTPAARRERAQALLAQMVGAIVLARALGQDAGSDALLDAVKRSLALPAPA